MAVSEDVMELVALLDSEDFSALAGEILTEISRGHEQEIEDGDGTIIERIPIFPDDQLGEAVKILKLRLTEPARKLVEAESLAGQLNGGGVVPIVFVDSDGQPESKLAPATKGMKRRSTEAIDRLEEGLARLVAIQNGTA